MKHPHKIDRSQYTTKKEEIQTSNSNKRKTMSSPETEFHEPAQVVIAGAGIVGLVLALALKKHVGITAELYEKAHVFHDDVGAALGFYPNGMRVLRDIDPELLYAIKEKGFPFVYRRWERHDGTEIAEAKESVLSEGDEELDSVGIRRWRLQKVLYEHVLAAGIPVHFCKATSDVVERKDGLVEVSFEDGTTRLTRILFGVDGGKSTVRQKVADPSVQLRYTGITCLMGMSNIPSQRLGINFPCSTSTNCHSVYFPTGKEEQCFQIHWPLEEEEADQGNWGNLDNALGQEECRKLAARLRADGWHERYCEPLDHVTHAVKVGFCLLEPRLSQWVYGTRGQVVLVGDAAHPPVPYLGQGAQMGVEVRIGRLLHTLCSLFYHSRYYSITVFVGCRNYCSSNEELVLDSKWRIRYHQLFKSHAYLRKNSSPKNFYDIRLLEGTWWYAG